MKNRLLLDPSISAIIDIDPVALSEEVNIYFTADDNWVGDFTINIFNSENKNQSQEITNALNVTDNVMTWTIAPTEQEISVGKKYYEIYDNDSKRIVFKGILNIIK